MIHLHVRSSFSLLSSTFKVKEIVEFAKRHNQSAIALVDFNVMYGSLAFFDACKEQGIKPIFGLEFVTHKEGLPYHFIMYAKNDIGFQTLMKLSTYLNTNQKYIEYETLKQFDNEVILTTAGAHDNLHSFLLKDEYNSIKNFLSDVKKDFSSFYIAVAMNDSGLLRNKNVLLQNAADALYIDTFALSRIYYKEEDNEEAYKALCAIAQQKQINDPSLRFSRKRYFRSTLQMQQLYSAQCIQNTYKIADACNVQMQFTQAHLPVFENKFNVDSNIYLRSLCKKGLEKRLENEVGEIYAKRLSYELDVISNMGFSDYFLIVYDFIRFAKSKKIYVGPGRGSAAGSLVSYCLGITQVDPIKYDLLFERFLNPERISMPDIDIDFPDDRREEVIQYVYQKYGKEHVAHIITFGTMKAKQVLRDVARVLQIPTRDVDMISKLVPNTLNVQLKKVFSESKKFQSIIMASKKFQELYNLAIQLEGLERHISTHAAGIVFAREEIATVCPLVQVESAMMSTQYTMEYLERLGLIKMDFLGLRNLTIIDEVVSQIDNELDILKIPLDDEKTFSLLQDVDTMGVFQLESEGMKNLLRKMRVSNFEQIVAAIALFRPGPMENIPLYLENKESDHIEYLHENIAYITKNTYGVFIYQEQIMQLAQSMANFSLGKADILRKAMSKKQVKEMQGLHKEFMQGSLKNGYSEEVAETAFGAIQKFAGYGFNRSHSFAYALIAYQLAYLKANYPLPFFCSLLNSVISHEFKTKEYLFEAKRRGIQVLPPCVNHSCQVYTIENGALRFPLRNIKNVGSVACDAIVNERSHKSYNDFFDFIARVAFKKVHKNITESLLDAGALDCFGYNRLSMKLALDDAYTYASIVSHEEDGDVFINMNLMSPPHIPLMKENAFIVAENEKKVLGFYLKEHPISKIRATIPHALSIIQLKQGMRNIVFVCSVERLKEHRTKTGEMMVFVGASDDTEKIDLVIMPNLYARNKGMLKIGAYLYIEGRIDKVNSCFVTRLKDIAIH